MIISKFELLPAAQQQFLIDSFAERIDYLMHKYPGHLIALIRPDSLNDMACTAAVRCDPSISDEDLHMFIVQWEMYRPEYFKTARGDAARVKDGKKI